MASIVTKMITKKILGETLQNKFGTEDPYFETVPATRLDGKPSKSKMKKRRKALPPGLSENDAKVLTKVKRRAYRLDNSFGSFLGIKFGWGSIIGLFPVVGDVLDGLMALMVVRTCQQVDGGLPQDVLSHMYFRVIIDLFIGLVPFIGDIMDAAYRANTRNVIALEDHLRTKGRKNIRKSGAPLPAQDPSTADFFDAQEDALDQPPKYSPTRTQNADLPAAPAAARVPEERRGGNSWFKGGSQRQREPDLERADLARPTQPPRRHESQRSGRNAPRPHY